MFNWGCLHHVGLRMLCFNSSILIADFNDRCLCIFVSLFDSLLGLAVLAWGFPRTERNEWTKPKIHLVGLEIHCLGITNINKLLCNLEFKRKLRCHIGEFVFVLLEYYIYFLTILFSQLLVTRWRTAGSHRTDRQTVRIKKWKYFQRTFQQESQV